MKLSSEICFQIAEHAGIKDNSKHLRFSLVLTIAEVLAVPIIAVGIPELASMASIDVITYDAALVIAIYVHIIIGVFTLQFVLAVLAVRERFKLLNLCLT